MASAPPTAWTWQVLRDRGEATLRRLLGQHATVDVLCAVATLARQEIFGDFGRVAGDIPHIRVNFITTSLRPNPENHG